MELLLVRHAEPVRIAAGERGGPADPELTPAGVAQAEQLAAWLAEERVDHVVSSPLARAQETAAPVARAHDLDVEVDVDLQEWDAHTDSYIPVEELRETNDDRWQAMIEGRWEDYGGEEPARFASRVVRAIDRIIDAHPGERVVVVCHGGVINVYLAALLGLDRHLWFDPAYTSVSRVHAARSGPRSLGSLNETGHLTGTRTARGT
jgi:probable phosphoglycerate mutase